MKLKIVKSVLATAIIISSASVWAEEVKQQLSQTKQEAINSQKSSGIDQQYFDQSVSVKDDFYQHVNGKWLKDTVIPAGMPLIDGFYELNIKKDEQLHKIIEEISTKKATLNAEEQKISDLYNSLLNENFLNHLGIIPIQNDLDRISKLKNKNDFGQLMAHLTLINVKTPIKFSVVQDAKNAQQMVVNIEQSGLGLPSLNYYLKEDDKAKVTREKYLTYIENMLKFSGDKQAIQHARDILKFETELAKIQWTPVQNRDLEKQYNPYRVNELQKLGKQFDWNAFLKTIDHEKRVKTVIIAQPSYIKGLNTILEQSSVETLAAYLKFRLIDDYAKYLSKDISDSRFNFKLKQLNGISEPRPRWQDGVSLVDNALGDSIGKIYVQQYFPAETKKSVENLVQNIIHEFDQNITQIDWLSSETKIGAKKKLATMVIKVGYPSKWKDYSDLTIKKDDLVGNVKRIQQFQFDQSLKKMGQPIDRTEWTMTPQTMNAEYNPALNEIVFPAVVLQAPFYDVNVDDAVNYGGIGAVIGHEISHAFDDQGSQYDEVGNMKDWWTDQDRQKFNDKAKGFIEQYSAYEPLKGYHVDGELTLGENIADNGGLSVAYNAYHHSLKGNPASVIDGFTGDQRFYMNWAQIWRSNVKEAFLLTWLKTDPHTPNKARVNVTLKNQTPFYDAFGIKQGDQMYISPEKRVTIW